MLEHKELYNRLNLMGSKPTNTKLSYENHPVDAM